MNWFYTNREERSKWLAERFEYIFLSSQTVLDIGCYNADLKKHIKNEIIYTGIDISGKPDVVIDLDKTEKLPFTDKQFETIVCADVLEHLDNFHTVFNEICRIASKNIIITLPNAHISIFHFLRKKPYSVKKELRLQYGKYSKFYGLPFYKPHDRHRWFFSFDEAKDFIEFHAQKNNYEIKVIESEQNYLKPSLKKFSNRMFNIFNSNLSQKHFICLLEKLS
jgi:ubiquinone/menaquinone biosynthesis C-methylase UbiE